MRDNTFTKTWSFSSQQTPPSGTTVVSLCPDVPGGREIGPKEPERSGGGGGGVAV